MWKNWSKCSYSLWASESGICSVNREFGVGIKLLRAKYKLTCTDQTVDSEMTKLKRIQTGRKGWVLSYVQGLNSTYHKPNYASPTQCQFQTQINREGWSQEGQPSVKHLPKLNMKLAVPERNRWRRIIKISDRSRNGAWKKKDSTYKGV